MVVAYSRETREKLLIEIREARTYYAACVLGGSAPVAYTSSDIMNLLDEVDLQFNEIEQRHNAERFEALEVAQAEADAANADLTIVARALSTGLSNKGALEVLETLDAPTRLNRMKDGVWRDGYAQGVEDERNSAAIGMSAAPSRSSPFRRALDEE